MSLNTFFACVINALRADGGRKNNFIKSLVDIVPSALLLEGMWCK